MALSWDEIQSRAIKFSSRWQAAAYERPQAQAFTIDFLRVFGLEEPERLGDFEYKVQLDDERSGYIDYLLKGKIAIEMKSRGIPLKEAYQQLKEYIVHLPKEFMPPLLMVCDFDKIVLYERLTGKSSTFQVKDLRKHIRRFATIAGYEVLRPIEKQLEVNVKAAELMAKLHNELKKFGYEGHNLEEYLSRLLFCLFADDTGIFPKDHFRNYIENSSEDGSNLAERLGRLFQVLDQSSDERTKHKLLTPTLLQFRYINGALFRDSLPLADFNSNMRNILLQCCNFDWNKISPAIFGSMFQGVMDEKEKHELGAHYTSEENILKVINPLFMDDLWKEFENSKHIPAKLEALHNKIANLKFLDPACGCGNFLIISYKELRKLELAILKMKVASSQRLLDIESLVKVRVNQFYGIEIKDFPCQVAKVGMWLMDHLMNLEVSDAFGEYFARLPLQDSAHIHHGNALKMDWNEVIPANDLSYILGNPPFSGARVMTKSQKEELLAIFSDVKNAGNLDYVTCWFRKAADMMLVNPKIKTGFVATNSICQGEQAGLLWMPIINAGFHINYAYRSFKWENEAKGKAAVHCVICGYNIKNEDNKMIYDGDESQKAKNINPYLADAPNICITSRERPLCEVPEIGIGNKPIDGGNYLFSEEEKDEFIKREPESEQFFRKWIGAQEFINGKKRYCLWLGDCSPEVLKTMPSCLKRIEAVKNFRLASKSVPTQKLADTPRRFHVENMPKEAYIAIPKVSTPRRNYIPMDFINHDYLSSDLILIVRSNKLYHLGILLSSTHNIWVRSVAGRLGTALRYSRDIVYNNFPWPSPNAKQKEKIERLTENILEIRKQFPNSTLGDLYDPNTMPEDLLMAHKELDKAVLKAYDIDKNSTESQIVKALFERYKELTENN